MILTLPYGTFEAPDTDYMNPHIQREGFHDVELRPFLDRVPAGAYVLDIGAHIGLYAGYLASRGVHVVAYEGHPVYLPLLQQNVARNQAGWPGVVSPMEVFCYSRWAKLVEQEEHETRASNPWLPVEPAEGTKDMWIGNAVPLDAFAHPYTIALLKVDTQGADLHVLLGAEELIARDRPPILIEYEAALCVRHGHTAEDYRAWVARHGYVEEPINGWNAYWRPQETL